MITGVVTSNREAIIRMLVHGTREQEAQVEAVIDTGFTGFLTLPARLIATLTLSFAGTTRAALADGSEVSIDVFDASVLWDSQEREYCRAGGGRYRARGHGPCSPAIA